MTGKTHSRFINGDRVEVARHGGVQAKRWRQKVANSATREPSDSFKTLSLPLVLDLPETQFKPSDKLYNAVEGFGEGSLGNLLLRVHLAGLSVFQNNAEAKGARQSNLFPLKDFDTALNEGMGLEIPKLTPIVILNLFQSVPRTSPPFTAEAIADRVHKACFNKKMDDRVDASLKDLLMAIGHAALRKASSYTDLKANALVVLNEVGIELKKLSPLFPSLSVVLREESIETVFAYEGVVESVPAEADHTYLLHHIIACVQRRDPDLSPAKVQDALLSYSDNALSQIFGALLFNARGEEGYLRTVAVDQFCADTGVPRDRRADVEKLLKAAKEIPAPPFFEEAHYASYRKTVSGKIRSWVSNYLTRLDVLSEQLAAMGNSTLPSEVGSEVEGILAGLDLTQDLISKLMAERQSALNLATSALNVLRGERNAAPAYEAAGNLEKHLKVISDIHGTFRSILNQVNQRLETVVTTDLEAWKKVLSVSESDAFALPRISGGTDPVEPSLEELNQSLAAYYDLFHRYAALVESFPSGGLERVIKAYQAQELTRAQAIPGRTLSEDDATELAKRRLLQSFYRLGTRLSSQNRDEILNQMKPSLLAGGIKVFNRLKFNNQGRIYRSPWAPGRHQPLPINWKDFEQTDWLGVIETLCTSCLKHLNTAPSGTSLQDYLEVKRFDLDLKILSLTQAIPSNKLDSELGLSAFDVHPRLKLALKEEIPSIATLSSLTAWMASQLAKFRFAARREKFIVRHKFSRVGQDDLLFVPKDRQWTPPASYFKAKGSISKQLADFVGSAEQVDNAKLFDSLANTPSSQTASLLVQMPHDWYLPLDFRESLLEDIRGLPVGKDTVRSPMKARKLVTSQATKIKGPSSYLTQFSKMLKGQTESGEWMLILDWVHKSAVQMREGRPALKAELESCQPRVAIPIKAISPEEDKFQFFDHIVAIDLGERQIGYAIFSVKDALGLELPNPINDPLTGQPAKGTIRVPGVRRLINAVTRHRGRQSSNTKLRQNFDTKLEELRENVGGEIVQRIEALMERFAAFPILESSVVNFQTGSRQLDLVYGDVVRTFAYSNIDAHKSARKEHWMGSDRWVHPYLIGREYDEQTGKRSGAAKPLSLFPGATVNPAGTSQVCNVCNRNALIVLRELGNTVVVKADGVVKTAAGSIRLLAGSNYTDDEFKAARRRKENLPLNAPAKEGKLNEREAIALARRTMRQKAHSQMSRDTSQSQFHCLFTDCKASYHADEGAAVNIGRKFFKDRVDVKLTLEKINS